MSQDRLLQLACQDCKRKNYWTSKNKKLIKEKLEFKKHCKHCKKHTDHKETKK